MSQRDKSGSSNHNQNSERNQENSDSGKTKVIVYLIFAAFVLGSVIASGVTFVLLKGNELASKNSTPSPASLPTPTPTLSSTESPTPTPTPSPSPSLVQPSPTPTGSPNISPQPTESAPYGSENRREVTSKNSELPGYFPNKGFTAPPSDLSRF